MNGLRQALDTGDKLVGPKKVTITMNGPREHNVNFEGFWNMRLVFEASKLMERAYRSRKNQVHRDSLKSNKGEEAKK